MNDNMIRVDDGNFATLPQAMLADLIDEQLEPAA